MFSTESGRCGYIRELAIPICATKHSIAVMFLFTAALCHVSLAVSYCNETSGINFPRRTWRVKRLSFTLISYEKVSADSR